MGSTMKIFTPLANDTKNVGHDIAVVWAEELDKMKFKSAFSYSIHPSILLDKVTLRIRTWVSCVVWVSLSYRGDIRFPAEKMLSPAEFSLRSRCIFLERESKTGRKQKDVHTYVHTNPATRSEWNCFPPFLSKKPCPVTSRRRSRLFFFARMSLRIDFHLFKVGIFPTLFPWEKNTFKYTSRVITN